MSQLKAANDKSGVSLDYLLHWVLLSLSLSLSLSLPLISQLNQEFLLERKPKAGSTAVVSIGYWLAFWRLFTDLNARLDVHKEPIEKNSIPLKVIHQSPDCGVASSLPTQRLHVWSVVYPLTTPRAVHPYSSWIESHSLLVAHDS